MKMFPVLPVVVLVIGTKGKPSNFNIQNSEKLQGSRSKNTVENLALPNRFT
jgi:hypothetical protein